MNITIYDVFELNRILHSLLAQQSSYKIQTAFKLHSLIKWLDETEEFVLERMKMMFDEESMNADNPLYVAFLSSQLPFVQTKLNVDDLLTTEGDVKLDVKDVEVLNKMLNKAES
jgi:hypothetical protein